MVMLRRPGGRPSWSGLARCRWRPSVRSGRCGGGHCPAARRALARGGYRADPVFFVDDGTATAAGYRPCAVCLPERYWRWKATGADRRSWAAPVTGGPPLSYDFEVTVWLSQSSKLVSARSTSSSGTSVRSLSLTPK